MDELQLGLLGLGVMAVGGVVGYNLWQARRHRALAEGLFMRKQVAAQEYGNEDRMEPGADWNAGHPRFETVDTRAMALPQEEDRGDGGRLTYAAHHRLPDPVCLEDDPAASPARGLDLSSQESVVLRSPSEESSPARAEQELVQSLQSAGSSEFSVFQPRDSDYPDLAPETRVDPLPVSPARRASAPVREADDNGGFAPDLLSSAIDYIVALDLVEAVPAHQILRSHRQSFAAIPHTVVWVGVNAESGQWERLDENSTGLCRRIKIGLQLADRRGPVFESGMAAFQNAVKNLADNLMSVVEFPEHQEALERATQLDAFCASVDIQVGINVVSDSAPFSGTKLRALAEAAGMQLEADGQYVRRDELGREVYRLANLENEPLTQESIRTLTTRGLVFVLDVPKVAWGDRTFLQMVEIARRFAENFKGRLVDDNGSPLQDAGIEVIRRQVAHFQGKLTECDLKPGGPLVQRLFS